MPIYTGLSQVACFANLGLPGLCGFVGEVMVLMGAFAAAKDDSIIMKATHGAAYPCIMTLAVIACFGVILTAGYMLWTIQRVYLGPEKAEYKGYPDVEPRELTVLTPLTIMAILLGVLPTLTVFIYTQSTVNGFFHLLQPAMSGGVAGL
jgi:NADH-quinone oxidoreductase subunit M